MASYLHGTENQHEVKIWFDSLMLYPNMIDVVNKGDIPNTFGPSLTPDADLWQTKSTRKRFYVSRQTSRWGPYCRTRNLHSCTSLGPDMWGADFNEGCSAVCRRHSTSQQLTATIPSVQLGRSLSLLWIQLNCHWEVSFPVQTDRQVHAKNSRHTLMARTATWACCSSTILPMLMGMYLGC